MNKNNPCPGCFQSKGTTSVCPDCGYDESQPRSPLILPYRTVLNGQFLIGKVLGKLGGFGITYLAFDLTLETAVAIKEYLPRELAGRTPGDVTVTPHSRDDAEAFEYGRQQFLQEGRTLARFNHANIVRVRTLFEANGTAYLVMDYCDGISLAEYLAQKGGRISEELAVKIMMPVLDGLREVHEKGFLHRDIKPQNIYLTKNGMPILLDFGSARFAVGERTRSMSVVMTPGYAPFEQYHRNGKQGPWTDIYACGATLYSMITGSAPPDAMERMQGDTMSKVSPPSSKMSAIMRALSVNPSNRHQTVAEFQRELMGNTSIDFPMIALAKKADIHSVGIDMIPVPAGEFEMGTEAIFWGFLSDDESPRHRVRISAFSMSMTPITQAQYKAITGVNPSHFTGDDNLPVERVSWWDAIKYCNALSAKAGLDRCYNEKTGKCNFTKNGFRLPTEAEWEYACRAGTETKYYTGNSESDLAQAGWYDNNSQGKTHQVGQKRPNAFGLHDMHGNVWEWCHDIYSHEYYCLSPFNDPINTAGSSLCVLRGGSWKSSKWDCRSAIRGGQDPSFKKSTLGFRVVRRP